MRKMLTGYFILVPPYPWFHLPMVWHGSQVHDPPSDLSSEGQQ